MNFLGNLVWLLFGGLISAILYMISGVVLCITVIGIPFGLQCFKIAGFVLWPFGSTIVTGDRSGGCLYILFNILWIFTGGLCTALSHIFFGVLLCLTIIGIPFGMQHFKLANLALSPFGKDIVYK
ncbi:MAG TPA: YccF domain-containing protein [Sediminibacterium sp.]|nr:YccF domain-containing protein [Sediminibacterium sp.]